MNLLKLVPLDNQVRIVHVNRLVDADADATREHYV